MTTPPHIQRQKGERVAAEVRQILRREQYRKLSA